MSTSELDEHLLSGYIRTEKMMHAQEWIGYITFMGFGALELAAEGGKPTGNFVLAEVALMSLGLMAKKLRYAAREQIDEISKTLDNRGNL